ncbi:MAG: NAD(P)-dependent oxidoreductase [Pseudomonadota bacterium]|nr:NAD(P)-dependent oxidoreductase [Pseudomonadota bacterium]
MTHTGFIGLGAMGAPMAAHLAQAGQLRMVYNRSPARAEAFAATHGVVAAERIEAVARACEVIVICVSADEDVKAVCEQLAPGLQAGSLVIDCSTVARETACAVAGQLEALGVGFVDAPVSGGTEGARQGSLTIMAGGRESDVQRAHPTLALMGGAIHHMGPVGAGQATKAVNQVLCAGINRAVTEALAFGESLGLPMNAVVDVVGSGAGGNWFINHRGKTMLRQHYPLGFKVSLHAKDLAICSAMAQSAGVDLPLTEQTRRDYAELMEQGCGDEDISALYRLIRPLPAPSAND